MSRLTLLESVQVLRMRTALIEKFTSHSPKGDGMKLEFSSSGTIEESDLIHFNQYLMSEWPSKRIPTYIENELKYEARDECGYCGNSLITESAHIDRKGIELDYYCQHPHNLIELCPNCHSRYDNKEIKNTRIKEKKNELIDRLIREDLNKLVVATTIRDEIEYIKSQTRAVFWGEIYSDVATIFYRQTNDPVFSNIETQDQLKCALEKSAEKTKTDNPYMTGLAIAYSEQVKSSLSRPITDFDLLEDEREEGECHLCGGATEVDDGSCNACGADLAGYYSDDLSDMLCPNCGSDDIVIAFEYTCGHCRNMLDSDKY